MGSAMDKHCSGGMVGHVRERWGCRSAAVLPMATQRSRRPGVEVDRLAGRGCVATGDTAVADRDAGEVDREAGAVDCDATAGRGIASGDMRLS